MVLSALVVHCAAAPFDDWKIAYGLTGSNALDTANPDKDRLTNIEEYAFGYNPTLNDTSGAPPVLVTPLGDYLEIKFTRPNSIYDIAYKVEASGNLSVWQDVTDNVVSVTENATAQSVTIRDSVLRSLSTRRFMRMNLSRASVFAPSNLTITQVSVSQNNLTWVDNTGNETAYLVQRRDGASNEWQPLPHCRQIPQTIVTLNCQPGLHISIGFQSKLLPEVQVP
ncbi:MAG: hypothetical protein HC901_00445 [Bdellovibrionaceae bacterium]|nr:hypothetical protein [Pseudobdellovibrionaceae bacterium]